MQSEAEAAAAAEGGNRRAQLAHAGAVLFGREWVSPMGREFGVAPRTMQRWASGESEIPDRVMAVDLPALVLRLGPDRLRDAERHLAQIKKLLDAAGVAGVSVSAP